MKQQDILRQKVYKEMKQNDFLRGSKTSILNRASVRQEVNTWKSHQEVPETESIY